MKRIVDVRYEQVHGLMKVLEQINPKEAPVHYAILDRNGQVAATIPAERYKAIIESTDESVIYGVVSQRYELINHSEIMKRIVPQLQQAGLIHKDTAINVGKMFSFWLTEKQHAVRIGDLVQFGVMVRNAIDGSMGFGIDFYSYRLSCLNGAVMSSSIAPSIRKRHVGLNLDTLEQVLSDALTHIDEIVHLYRKAAETNLPIPEVRKIIEEMHLPKYITVDVLKDTPSNAWEAYNALTLKITRSNANTYSKTQYYQETEHLLRAISR